MVKSRNRKITRIVNGVTITPQDIERKRANQRWLRSKRIQSRHPLPLLPYTVYEHFTYPSWWNTKARNRIRNRDSYVCQLCEGTGDNKTLHVHHINYDKRDCGELNLTTLCYACHKNTNSNRLYWYRYFWEIKHR